MPPAPVPRLDGAAIQIDNLLYVFAGYGTIDYVTTPPALDYTTFHILRGMTMKDLMDARLFAVGALPCRRIQLQ